MTEDSWNEYRRLILSELERIDKECSNKAEQCREQLHVLGNSIHSARSDIEMLKMKAGVWGFLAGFVPAAIVAVYSLLS